MAMNGEWPLEKVNSGDSEIIIIIGEKVK